MKSILLSKMRSSTQTVYEVSTTEDEFFTEFEKQAEKSGLGIRGFYLTRKYDGTICVDHTSCVVGYVNLRGEKCQLRYFKNDFEFEDLDELSFDDALKYTQCWLGYVRNCLSGFGDLGIADYEDADTHLAHLDELNRNRRESLGVGGDTLSAAQPTKNNRKGCAIVAGIFGGIVVAFIILVVVLASTLGKNAPASEANSDGTHTSQLANVMGLTAEQEEAVLDVFAECGIGEVKSVELLKKGEQRTSYYVEDDETIHYNGADSVIVVWIGNSSRSVKAIYYNDETIYEKGKVNAQLSDFYVPYEMIEDYRVAAQMLIDECLMYPKTAKYGAISKWAFGVHDGLDVVQSTVSAKNSFGMEAEMKFTVKFDRKTQTPVSILIDDEEMMD